MEPVVLNVFFQYLLESIQIPRSQQVGGGGVSSPGGLPKSMDPAQFHKAHAFLWSLHEIMVSIEIMKSQFQWVPNNA